MDFIRSSEKTLTLFAAIDKVQQEISPAKKDAVNTYHKNRYATIGSILQALRGPLKENGLVVAHFPAGRGMLQRIHHHTSGEFYESYLDFKDFLGTTGPQPLAGMITYMRRYMLTAVFMIETEDDDGETATGRTQASSRGSSQPSAALQAPSGAMSLGTILNDLHACTGEGQLQELVALQTFVQFYQTGTDEAGRKQIDDKIATKVAQFQEAH